MPDGRIADLARRSVERALPAGEVLALRGGQVRSIYGVRQGYLKAMAYSVEGHAFLADIVGPGSWGGFAPLLRGVSRYRDLEAEVESKVILIEGASVGALLSQHPEIYREIALLITQRYEMTLNQLRVNSFSDAEASLAFRLSTLLTQHGEPDPGGGVALPFRLSQEELGQLIGVTREAVGRCLRKWEREGWVDLGYARLILRQPDRLKGRSE